MLFEKTIAYFGALTPLDLPGKEAHKAMIPINLHKKHLSLQNIQIKDSAVLLLLYLNQNNITTVLIKRPEYNGHHSGQISFPGGKFDIRFDKDLKDTALRETSEEIGISKQSISILTALSPIHIQISNMNVFPFIGFCKEVPTFSINSEVEYIIEVPINQIICDTNKKKITQNIDGELATIPIYNLNNEIVWGATAMIMSEFEYLLKQIC